MAAIHRDPFSLYDDFADNQARSVEPVKQESEERKVLKAHLVHAAGPYLTQNPHEAEKIAKGITAFLNTLGV